MDIIYAELLLNKRRVGRAKAQLRAGTLNEVAERSTHHFVYILSSVVGWVSLLNVVK